MRAEIIAIGAELLGAQRTDTNSLYLAGELADLGIPLQRKAVLPDDVRQLAACLAAACRRAEVVICTGGLGPTEDDRTVAAAARALRLPLVLDPRAERRLRLRVHRRGRRLYAADLRQTLRLQPARWLANRVGSALGQWCPTARGCLILLPGPPGELQPMFAAQVRPRLRRLAPPAALASRVLSVTGLPESEVDRRAAPLYRRVANPSTTILAVATPHVELHFRARAATRQRAQVLADTLARRVERRLGKAVFSREGHSLAEVVGATLAARGHTVAVAESCTGGALAAALTDEPGSSLFFRGGVVCYSNDLKVTLAGVEPSALAAQGAVSAVIARQLARGARQRLGADWGVGITGIAGPGGARRHKPVGTVFIGLCGPASPARARRYRFFGERGMIRRGAVQAALNLLRQHLD